MNLLIMGPPGAGKGTQAILIKNMYNLVHISTGEMFRKAYMDKEPLGILAHEYIKKGELVPDDITLCLVEETLKKVPIKQGFILDGFPRTLNQAVKLDEILERLSLKIDAVLNLVISYESLVERIIGRRICKNCQAVYHITRMKPKVEGICDLCGGELIQRKDDTYEAITRRYEIYNQTSKPILDYYQKKNLVYNINSEDNIEVSFIHVQKLLEGLNDNAKK